MLNKVGGVCISKGRGFEKEKSGYPPGPLDRYGSGWERKKVDWGRDAPGGNYDVGKKN